MDFHEIEMPGLGGTLILPRILIDSQTASNVAQIDFTGLDQYRQYMIEIDGLTSVSDAVSFSMRISLDNGSTFESDVSDYTFGGLERRVGAEMSANESSGEAEFTLNVAASAFQFGTAANESGAYWIWIYDLGDLNHYPIFSYNRSAVGSTGAVITGTASGRYTTQATMNAVRFRFLSGNISTGRFRLYGIKDQ